MDARPTIEPICPIHGAPEINRSEGVINGVVGSESVEYACGCLTDSTYCGPPHDWQLTQRIMRMRSGIKSKEATNAR